MYFVKTIFLLSTILKKKHNSSYKLKKLNKFIAFNFFYNNYLKIFQKKIDYFRSTNEKNLLIIKNFRKMKKKVMQKAQKKVKKKSVYEVY